MLRNGVRWEDLKPPEHSEKDESKSPIARETENHINSKKEHNIIESPGNVGVKDTKIETRKI